MALSCRIPQALVPDYFRDLGKRTLYHQEIQERTSLTDKDSMYFTYESDAESLGIGYNGHASRGRKSRQFGPTTCREM